MDFLSAMRIYVRVVERGGLSAAARDLGLGQPTVSDRIGTLERHLGVRLLDRTTRSVQPTDAGQRFYEQARLAVAAADEALVAAGSDDRALSGILRLAAPHGLGEVTLPSLLLTFQGRYPAMSVDLVLNDRLVDPVTEGVDLSLRVGETGEGGFVARRIGWIQSVLLASPACLDRDGVPDSPADLARHRLVRLSGGRSAGGRLTLIGPEGVVVVATIGAAWRVNHWRPLLAAVEGGVGVGLLPPFLCADALSAGRLVPVLPGYRPPRRPVSVLYPAGPRLPTKTRAFLDLIRDNISTLLPSGAGRDA